MITLGKKFERNPPAIVSEIQEIEGLLGFQFPESYKAFLLQSNGGEGFVGEEGYINLFKIQEISETYEVCGFKEYCSNYLPIGSNGGGEAFVVRYQSNATAFGYMPFIGMENSCFVEIDFDFFECIRKIGAGSVF